MPTFNIDNAALVSFAALYPQEVHSFSKHNGRQLETPYRMLSGMQPPHVVVVSLATAQH
jgi:hypothetical protein